MSDRKCPGKALKHSRRDFLKLMAAGGALSVSSGGLLKEALAQEGESAAPPRAKPRKLFYEGEKPLLVVVEGKDVDKMLRKGIEALGGIDKLVKGKKVLMKPNCVSVQAPPVTTGPDFILALGKLLMEAGGSHVTINDASAMYAEEGEQKFKALKINPRATEAGFTAINTITTAADHYRPVHNKNWRRFKEVNVNKLIYGADVVVSCPAIKRHDVVHISCALKNHFGSVYGPNRWKAHEEADKGGDGLNFFKEAPVEFASAVNPELTIVDGRVMLTRGGPHFVEGRTGVERADRIVFGEDPVAVEAYCATLLDAKDETFSAEQIRPAHVYAEQLGLGTWDLKKVIIKEITV
jgi:uncharacterized protein (DUF362 family)